MIALFHVPNCIIDTSKFSNLLSDHIVRDLESEFADYVGAKYACSFNSATSAIFLIFNKKNIVLKIPSILPPVVANALLNAQNKIEFVDNIEWVGDSYLLHQFQDYKVIDSAQKVIKNQFKLEANPEDLMIFSFYPTKPISGSDGGMVVSNDLNKIEELRMLTQNGMSSETNNWDRSIKFIGWKMYMNSIQAYIIQNNMQFIESKYNRLDEIRARYDREFGEHTSYHLYRINVKNNQKFIEEMKKCGITCGIHYRALHLNPLYNTTPINLSLSEQEEKSTVSIPFHEDLTEEEIESVIQNCKRLYGSIL